MCVCSELLLFLGLLALGLRKVYESAHWRVSAPDGRGCLGWFGDGCPCFSMKTWIVAPNKSRLVETILMRVHNMCSL